MALYFECRINKTALLQIAFLVILPTGQLDKNKITFSHLSHIKWKSSQPA